MSTTPPPPPPPLPPLNFWALIVEYAAPLPPAPPPPTARTRTALIAPGKVNVPSDANVSTTSPLAPSGYVTVAFVYSTSCPWNVTLSANRHDAKPHISDDSAMRTFAKAKLCFLTFVSMFSSRRFPRANARAARRQYPTLGNYTKNLRGGGRFFQRSRPVTSFAPLAPL